MNLDIDGEPVLVTNAFNSPSKSINKSQDSQVPYESIGPSNDILSKIIDASQLVAENELLPYLGLDDLAKLYLVNRKLNAVLSPRNANSINLLGLLSDMFIEDPNKSAILISLND